MAHRQGNSTGLFFKVCGISHRPRPRARKATCSGPLRLESHDQLWQELEFKTRFFQERLPYSRGAQLKLNTFLIQQIGNDFEKILRLGIPLRP